MEIKVTCKKDLSIFFVKSKEYKGYWHNNGEFLVIDENGDHHCIAENNFNDNWFK